MPCRAGAQPRWSLSRGSSDGVAEPDPDRGEVDGSAERVVAFVVAGGHRPVGFELVDGAFDDVALLVDLGVEPGWPPTLAAAAEPILLLVRGFGNGGLDPALPQVGADPAAGVGLIAQHPAGSAPWPAGSSTADPDPGQHRPKPQAVVPLPGTGHPRDRPTPPVSGQVNLARQPAAGPADRFPDIRSPRTSSRARTRSRAASCSTLGTATATISPRCSRRARCRASRTSVFTRSPHGRCNLDGAATWQSIPCLARYRARPNPVGPAS